MKYDEAVTQFLEDKRAYEDALDLETKRVNNVFALIFDPPIAIPSKPTAPMQPSPYKGLYLEYNTEEFTAAVAEQNTTQLDTWAGQYLTAA